ncbi:hypothetical protein GCM10008921_22870 [Metaclostridioides mangenotii]
MQEISIAIGVLALRDRVGKIFLSISVVTRVIFVSWSLTEGFFSCINIYVFKFTMQINI